MADIPDKKPTPKWLWRTLDIAGATFWLYAITKLFIFDIDVWLVNQVVPGAAWILIYKFPIMVVFAAIALWIVRSALFAAGVISYVLFFPLIVLLWKIPYFIFKQKSWLLAFAAANALIVVFRRFKVAFFITAAYIACLVVIWSTRQPIVLNIAATGILILLLGIYAKSFVAALRPSAIFQVYKKFFPAIRKTDFLKVDQTLAQLPVETLTSEQALTRINALQNVVLYNRSCLFISRKLRDYHKSRMRIIPNIIGLFGLFALTVLSFALINFGLFKSGAGFFKFENGSAQFFSFLYYSMGSMFQNSDGLVPISPVSQGVQMIQFTLALFLLVILATEFVTARNEKNSAELNEVVDTMEQEERTSEEMIRQVFNIESVTQAIQALETAKAGMIGVIVFLTKSSTDRP